MSENRMVTVPSAAATRAISLRSSIAQVAKSSIELSSIPRTPCSRTLVAVSTKVFIAAPAACRVRPPPRGATPLGVQRFLELEHLGLGLGELLGEHADRGDRGSQQHPEEDRDHGEGGHAPTMPQARAPARAAGGSMR